MSKIVKYILIVALIGDFHLQSDKIINVYKNQGAYIHTCGTASQEVTSDNAVIEVVITNNTDSLKDVMVKHDSDVSFVNEFLLKHFDASEFENKGINIEKNYVNKDTVEKLFSVRTVFKVNTKKIDVARKIPSQLNSLLQKDINVQAVSRYFYKNIDKIIDDLIIRAVKDSRTVANKIAKTSGSQVTNLRICEKPQIKYSTQDNNSDRNERGVMMADVRFASSYDPNDESYAYVKKVTISVDAKYNIA